MAAGNVVAQVNTMVASGFTDPIECSEMFRVSFVVGGGKKVRQKYGDGRVLKDLTTALQGLGFEDDKGASCCLASAGTYKYQHNTDTDLKTVHASPAPLRVAPAARLRPQHRTLPQKGRAAAGPARRWCRAGVRVCGAGP